MWNTNDKLCEIIEEKERKIQNQKEELYRLNKIIERKKHEKQTIRNQR